MTKIARVSVCKKLHYSALRRDALRCRFSLGQDEDDSRGEVHEGPV
jgi:hypothetical protein